MQKIIIGREYPDVITKLTKEAKQSIKILMYDWRWYPTEQGSKIQKFNNEIIQSSRRGVDVNVLINSRSNFDYNVFEYFKIKRVNSSKVMHVKMLIFDSKYLVIGSHNLTKNAFSLNHEVSILSDDQEAIKRCEDFFNSLCLL